jgi:hypothetical protein
MTDNRLGEPETPTQTRLQTAIPRLALVVGIPGNGKTTLGNQFGFHHAAAVSLLSRCVATAHAPPTDAGA